MNAKDASRLGLLGGALVGVVFIVGSKGRADPRWQSERGFPRQGDASRASKAASASVTVTAGRRTEAATRIGSRVDPEPDAAHTPGSGKLDVLPGIVGGVVHAVASAPLNKKMTGAKWTVSGTVKSQTYQKSLGETVTVPTFIAIRPWGGDPPSNHWRGRSVPGDVLTGMFWDDRPGGHAVSVDITYPDGRTEKLSATANVIQPIVRSFWVSYGPTEWIGTGFATKILYGATVIVPEGVCGDIAIIQTRIGRNEMVNLTKEGAQATHTMITPGAVLDCNPISLVKTAQGTHFPNHSRLFLSTEVPEDGVATLPCGRHDRPLALMGIDAETEVGCLSIRFENTFKDHLVYRAPEGVWVRIAETTEYTVSGSAKWVGSFTNGRWEQVSSPSPASPTTIKGNSSLGWVRWNDCAPPKYTRWNPPVGNP